MGNIGSHTTQISGSRIDRFRVPQQPVKSYPKINPPVKVLPDPQSRQRLRHTNNGDILQSGGTLSGRHQVPLRNGVSDGYRSDGQNHQSGSSQNRFNSQVKSYKSEPDLRFPKGAQDLKENRSKKKYRAPAPPNEKRGGRFSDLNEDVAEEYPQRRARLYKTRVETKKESSQINTNELSLDSTPDCIEEKIQPNPNTAIYARPNRLSLPAFDLLEHSEEFKEEIKQVTERFKENANQNSDTAKSQVRGEPSGKESSTAELSPDLRSAESKPRVFYFGMDREDSDASSNCHPEEDDDTSAIALRLRPVLPRKPPQIPHFSPSVAWRLLDARSQDSGISGDARPSFSSSWTPQQDLGDDSSLEEIRKDLPKSYTRHVPHVFSLSLPRDLQPAAFTTLGSSKFSSNNFGKLKRSVSGVLNTLTRRDTEHRDQGDENWFLSRSAPNSINDNSPDSDLHISPNSRVMYLPENSTKLPDMPRKYSSMSKSCEDLKIPESLCDAKVVSKEEPVKKPKKFTFQSTVRQIERRKMAEKLSKEAERKEKQRLRELEAMRKVEEEFQMKRAKEKANIRNQLRLYALDETQWSSLPFELNQQHIEERQEPDGALSSSASSPAANHKYNPPQTNDAWSESKKTTQGTQELSEYRQIQRDYKDYRGSAKYSAESRMIRQTTVHPEVTCNMPNAKDTYHESDNYRKEFAFGIKQSRSVDSNPSEESPKIYRSKFSPITRF